MSAVSAESVSVVVPVFNAERYLARAIGSILDQPTRPGEIIVVDDGSTDASPRIAADFGPPVSLVRQENRGPSAARNRGIAEARGDLLAFLDADDLWPRRALELQLERFAADPALAAAVGRIRLIRDAPGGIEEFGESWHLLVVGALLVRKDAFERVGPFDESMRYGEDVDWFYRAREAGLGIALHDAVTLLYRRHEANMTNQGDLGQQYFLLALKRSLERRRAAGAGNGTPQLPAWKPENR